MNERNSYTDENGWIVLTIPPKFETAAKNFRLERDRQYGNIYPETNSDKRWVGDLGEFAFKSWLKHCCISDFEWITEASAGKHDFTVLGSRIGVKTVKRKVQTLPSYTAQITAQHAKEPVDHYFFMSYEINQKKMCFLGGIGKEDFLKKAIFHDSGDWVHAKYQVRKGHEIYNIGIENLLTPMQWLKSLC